MALVDPHTPLYGCDVNPAASRRKCSPRTRNTPMRWRRRRARIRHLLIKLPSISCRRAARQELPARGRRDGRRQVDPGGAGAARRGKRCSTRRSTRRPATLGLHRTRVRFAAGTREPQPGSGGRTTRVRPPCKSRGGSHGRAWTSGEARGTSGPCLGVVTGSTCQMQRLGRVPRHAPRHFSLPRGAYAIARAGRVSPFSLSHNLLSYSYFSLSLNANALHRVDNRHLTRNRHQLTTTSQVCD